MFETRRITILQLSTMLIFFLFSISKGHKCIIQPFYHLIFSKVFSYDFRKNGHILIPPSTEHSHFYQIVSAEFFGACLNVCVLLLIL